MIAAYTTELRRLRRATTGKQAAFAAALVVFIIVILVAAPQAQQPRRHSRAATVPPAAVDGCRTARPTIDLLVGRSTVLNVGATDRPRVADGARHRRRDGHRAHAAADHGKQPGTISLFVWDRGGASRPTRSRCAAT